MNSHGVEMCTKSKSGSSKLFEKTVLIEMISSKGSNLETLPSETPKHVPFYYFLIL